ncbi:hypothetical protein [Litoribrevibacter euphylliae]
MSPTPITVLLEVYGGYVYEIWPFVEQDVTVLFQYYYSGKLRNT